MENITLSEYFTHFIGEQVNSGRYQSTNEVICAGLRLLENETQQIETLRQLVEIGEMQADRAEFVDYSLADAIAEIENGCL